jgi:hypothetical protein
MLYFAFHKFTEQDEGASLSLMRNCDKIANKGGFNMRIKSIFVFSFLIISFLFLALPQNVNSSVLHGCCIVDNECLGCESGCATSEGLCEDAGSESHEGICFNDGGGAACDDSSGLESEVGCCVTGPRNCEDNVGWRNCVGDATPNFEGIIWTPEVSCSEVPICTETNIPAVSEWGLIAIAGILGFIGLFMIVRRKKAAA